METLKENKLIIECSPHAEYRSPKTKVIEVELCHAILEASMEEKDEGSAGFGPITYYDGRK